MRFIGRVAAVACICSGVMLIPFGGVGSRASAAACAAVADDGAALLKAGKFAEAEAAFRAVLAGHPEDTGALTGLAEALEGQKKFDEAAKTYERLADVLTKKAETPAPKPVAPAAQPPKVDAPAQPPVIAPPAPPAAAEAPKAENIPTKIGVPTVGEVIEVKDSGGKWYKSTVRKVDGEKRFIHYEGWGDNWDEWVMPDRVRPWMPPAPPGEQPAQNIPTRIGAPTVGEVIDVKDNGGQWYKSTVRKVDGEKRFIHYEGWGDNWDEWVMPDRVRPWTPPAPAAPLKLTYPTRIGAPVAGEVLHAMDVKGNWLVATVVRVDGDKRFVRYRGWDEGFNEWVTPDKVKALTAAEAVAMTKKRSLDGWFVKTEISRFGGSRLICTYYWFRPDGSVYFGNPFANGAADFAAAQRAEPKNCGKYEITGEDLTIQRPGEKTEFHTYSPGAGGIMDSCPLQPVWKMKDGARLEGTWSIDYSGTFGGVHSVSSNSWTFRKDGTFEHTVVGGVETTAHVTGTGAAPGNAVGVDAPIEKGTYAFTGGMLKVTGEDGRSKAFSVWGVGKAEMPSPFGIDGLELNQVR